MPDCLEMPYWPDVEGAEKADEGNNLYRLGGNSCLSGDWLGTWRFPKPLHIGQEIVLKDMIHYTTVKTNMFNGIHHPSIAVRHTNGEIEVLREYRYEDYRDRMD